MDGDCGEGEAGGETLLAVLQLRDLGLQFLDLGLLVAGCEQRFEGGLAVSQLLQLLLPRTTRRFHIRLDAFQLSAGLHGLKQGSGLADVVVEQFGVVLEEVVLAEVQVLVEVGFEGFAAGEQLAVAGGVVLADELLFEFGEDGGEAVGWVGGRVLKSRMKWFLASAMARISSRRVDSFLSMVLRIYCSCSSSTSTFAMSDASVCLLNSIS